VRSGGGLVLAVGPEIDADLVADVLGGDATLRVSPVAPVSAGPARAFAPADVRHPVFQPFASNAAALGLVRFRQAARVEGRACQTIARFTTGDAAMLDCAAGDGRALVLASDLNDRWNDFPLHATFVPFVQEAVRYAGSARDPVRLSADEFQSAITRMKDAGSSEVRGEARQQEDRQHLWQYAIALMAIALVAEGLLAARTV